jgi:hypothetical protein
MNKEYELSMKKQQNLLYHIFVGLIWLKYWNNLNI